MYNKEKEIKMQFTFKFYNGKVYLGSIVANSFDAAEQQAVALWPNVKRFSIRMAM